jgi:hypothetical protein
MAAGPVSLPVLSITIEPFPPVEARSAFVKIIGMDKCDGNGKKLATSVWAKISPCASNTVPIKF